MDDIYLHEIADRLAYLRQLKQTSARDMSLSLGQNPNYINMIETEKNYPSMVGFLYICDYLNVTPAQFFDMEVNNPPLINKITQELKQMDDNSLTYIFNLLKEMNKKPR